VWAAGLNGFDPFPFDSDGVSTFVWRDGEAMIGTPGFEPIISHK
jgi:hypothetical protein